MVYSVLVAAAAAGAGWAVSSRGVPWLVAAGVSLLLAGAAIWVADGVLRWLGFRCAE